MLLSVLKDLLGGLCVGVMMAYIVTYWYSSWLVPLVILYRLLHWFRSFWSDLSKVSLSVRVPAVLPVLSAPQTHAGSASCAPQRIRGAAGLRARGSAAPGARTPPPHTTRDRRRGWAASRSNRAPTRPTRAPWGGTRGHVARSAEETGPNPAFYSTLSVPPQTRRIRVCVQGFRERRYLSFFPGNEQNTILKYE